MSDSKDESVENVTIYSREHLEERKEEERRKEEEKEKELAEEEEEEEEEERSKEEISEEDSGLESALQVRFHIVDYLRGKFKLLLQRSSLKRPASWRPSPGPRLRRSRQRQHSTKSNNRASPKRPPA